MDNRKRRDENGNALGDLLQSSADLVDGVIEGVVTVTGARETCGLIKGCVGSFFDLIGEALDDGDD